MTARARLETGYWIGDEQYDRTITSKVTAPPPATALFIIMFTNTAAATKTLKKVQFSDRWAGSLVDMKTPELSIYIS